jgi:Flp pilus assembly protein TadD
MKEQGESLSLLLILGVLLYQDGDLERAATAFRKAIALSPRGWRAYRNLAMVYRKTGNTAFAETFMARAAEYRKAEEAGQTPPGKK